MGIDEREKQLARDCVAMALEAGASEVRVSLSKSVSDSYAVLDGELDKVTHCADRSIFLHLFVGGRFGMYSTNRLEKDQLRDFIDKCVAATRLLAPDKLRRLPAPDLCEKEAKDGREAGLYDPAYETLSADDRLAISSRLKLSEKVLSFECEYADNIDDNFLVDSNGIEARHLETSFSVCSEVTIEDSEGRKYSAYWWESSPFLEKLLPLVEDCPKKALERAKAQVSPQRTRGGRKTMVVDTTVASRLVAPLIQALYASSIQQKNSFLDGKLGEKVFGDGLTLSDLARTPGHPGARLFDTEGVATANRDIISAGTVNMYFIDTYMSGKLGMDQNIEGPSVPTLLPYRPELVAKVRSGILVTGFNGGNCNSATGDFSYGVEGFAIRDGRIAHPVRELVITGNMVSLWNSLWAAGTDARSCSRWQIPTLVFDKVSFCQ